MTGTHAERPAEPSLLAALLDDAALLVSGPTPVDRAVSRHLASAAEAHGEVQGHLHVPAGRMRELVALKRSRPLSVAVVGAPGRSLTATRAALDLVEGDPTLTVAAVTVTWAAGWVEAGSWGWPLSVRIPLDERSQEAIEDVAGHSAAQSAVQALFDLDQDQVTAPTVHQLAIAVRRCVDLDLGYALVGGAPAAVTRIRGQDTSRGLDVGVLNVLSASRYALAHAAEVAELVELLLDQDAERVLAIITRMSGADASVVRAFCTAYGCTAVRDVIADLAAMRLLTAPV